MEDVAADLRHLLAFYGVCEVATAPPAAIIELETGKTLQFDFIDGEGRRFLGRRGAPPAALIRREATLTTLSLLDGSGKMVVFVAESPDFRGYVSMPSVHFHGRVSSRSSFMTLLPSSRMYQYRF